MCSVWVPMACARCAPDAKVTLARGVGVSMPYPRSEFLPFCPRHAMAKQRKGVTRNTTPRPALRYGPRPAPADCGLPTSDALRHINESTPFACTNFVYICRAIRNESEAQHTPKP